MRCCAPAQFAVAAVISAFMVTWRFLKLKESEASG
jgi:hypothetical protein